MPRYDNNMLCICIDLSAHDHTPSVDAYGLIEGGSSGELLQAQAAPCYLLISLTETTAGLSLAPESPIKML
jgi:hypothetical protein